MVLNKCIKHLHDKRPYISTLSLALGANYCRDATKTLKSKEQTNKNACLCH